MESNFIPSERLRVFISSAQNNEGSFSWQDIRRRIKDYMKKCAYLNPFIIEDVTEATPSSQLYQLQLKKSDIVVLLVKCEVRTGTATEYALATKLHKPLLVYFLDDGSMPSLSAAELKCNIQELDYCTYRKLSSFENIEHEVYNDVIENVIRYYQNKDFYNPASESGLISYSPVNGLEQYKRSTPTKDAILQFKSCYSYIYELLGFDWLKSEHDFFTSSESDEISSFHQFGISALKWLVCGEVINCDSDIIHFIEGLSDLYPSTNWLQKRWDAIRYALNDDTKQALACENTSLQEAKSTNQQQWIINNILIDCRNFEIDVANQNREFIFGGEAQSELSESETIVYLPVLDRYLGEIYESIEKDEFKIKTALPNTEIYGSNILNAIRSVENYYFSSLVYGSYTHMLISRSLLSMVLSRYGELANDSGMLFTAIKLCVLRGDAKEFAATIDYKWDQIYHEITSFADEIWLLANKSPFTYRDKMVQTVLEKLGLYLSDGYFNDAVTYLENFVSQVYWGTSELFLDCILQNIKRIEPSSVVSLITEIIRNKQYHLGSKISRIILSLNFELVGKSLLVQLRDALIEQLPTIVKNNGSPQIIAVLVNVDSDIFSRLRDIPNNGLVGIEKTYYDINTGINSWAQLLEEEINTAIKQFQQNNRPGYRCYSAFQPYLSIKNIIREHYSVEMDTILEDSFFSHCNEVLNSGVNSETKSECIDCLCDVLVFVKSSKSLLSEGLAETIKRIFTNETLTTPGTGSSLSCNMLMLGVIIGEISKDRLIEWSFSFGKKSTNEKLALIRCVEQYLFNCGTIQEDIDSVLLSIVMQCFEDDYFAIRKVACSCFSFFLNTRYHKWAEEKIYEAASDPSHYVRGHILHLCKSGEIQDEHICRKIIEIMRNDANYAIRINASHPF